MEDDENSATGLASPCIGLAFTPKAMAAGEVDPGAGSRVNASSYPLREAVSTSSLPSGVVAVVDIVLTGMGCTGRSSGATATSAS